MTDESDRRDKADIGINHGLEQLLSTQDGSFWAVNPAYEASIKAIIQLAKELTARYEASLERIALLEGKVENIETYYCEDCECRTRLG
jgi:hypothetical protein